MRKKGISFSVAGLTVAVLVLCWLIWIEREKHASLVTELESATAKATASRPRTAAPAPARPSPPVRLAADGQAPTPIQAIEREEQRLEDGRSVLVDRKLRERAVQKRYAYLFEALGPLDVAATGKLKALLADRDEGRFDADRGAIKQGIAPNSAAYRQAASQASAEVNRAIDELLGEKAEEFARLDRLSAIVESIGGTFGGDMAFAGAPLTRDQTLRLAEVMLEIHFNPRDPEYRKLHFAPADPATGLKPLFRELLASAATVLSPEQLKVIRTYNDELVARQVAGTTAGSGPP
jgi:hypothetical protein